MLKSFARAAGFLAYLLITLEMLFMVTPFALYYYSVYSPLLAGPFGLPATAWLPAFFLPHLSTEILPSIGGLIFLPGEPGRHLQERLFGWIRHRRVRLIVMFTVSLAVTISAAFGLRGASFALTKHMILPERKIAAVSFLSGDDRQLRDLIRSAEAAGDVQNQMRGGDSWMLV